MTLLIYRIEGRVKVRRQNKGRIWRFEGEHFTLHTHFSEDPSVLRAVGSRETDNPRIKDSLEKVRAVWGLSEKDMDDLVHDRRTSQILDNRRGGVEIGLPYNDQDPVEHSQIRNFTTLLVNLASFLTDKWIASSYPQYAPGLSNIRRALVWIYGKGTGAFLRVEMIAGKKRLGVPLEVYHDASVEPYYAGRDKDGKLVGRGTGHGF